MPGYHKIIGPEQVNTNTEFAYIRVLPKSNMVGTSIFFRVYAFLLNAENPPEEEFGYKHSNPHLFGKTDYAAFHGSCPGFPLPGTDPAMFARWKQLTYYTSGWDQDPVPERITRVANAMATNDMAFLDKCKFVFGFRNVLDHCASYWRHQWHSFTDDHTYKTGKNGKTISLEEFMFAEGGVGSWIKQFITFHTIAPKFPDMFLFVPYEEHINNRQATLTRMINHLGIPLDERALRRAMRITSLDSMRAFENKIGGSISRDQSLASERHVRNGGIGYWQTLMKPEMVQRTERLMNEFGLSLRMFHLANQLDSQFSFVSPMDRPSPTLTFISPGSSTQPSTTTATYSKNTSVTGSKEPTTAQTVMTRGQKRKPN